MNILSLVALLRSGMTINGLRLSTNGAIRLSIESSNTILPSSTVRVASGPWQRRRI
jgi:hypothetical protein